MQFSTFGLNAALVAAIRDLGFTRPTPIQADAIGPAMEGRDILGCAATGSGKTAAFLLPTMHHLLAPRTAAPAARRRSRALVLTPTRELAAQIHQNFVELATHTPLTGGVIIGGVAMGPQEHAFRSGADILIATPGRLLDHLKHSYADLAGLEVLVLDEADRMLDMGFLPDIRRILRVLPAKRQTLFFSATMPGQIRILANELLKNPVTIQMERQSAPAAGITQAIYPVNQNLKTKLLTELLKAENLQTVICFTRTKHRANQLADYLTRQGVACARIHGNRSQAQRTAALDGFKAGRYRVLVATDIAARGIDINEVSHVINFDCPHLAEDYIHRVGRTGRAAATGDAFTFVSPEEEGNLRIIERAISKRLPRITLPDFDYSQRPQERLEVPLADRIAAIRARKAEERQRGAGRRDGGRNAGHSAGHGGRHAGRGGHAGPRGDGDRGGYPARGKQFGNARNAGHAGSAGNRAEHKGQSSHDNQGNRSTADNRSGGGQPPARSGNSRPGGFARNRSGRQGFSGHGR